MTRFLIALLAAISVAFPAWSQLPPAGGITIDKTPVQGGTVGDCLYVTSAGKIGNTVCGSASNITVGTTTITSGTDTRLMYDNAGVLGEALIRYSAANLKLGDVDAAAPVAQTLSVQNVVAGTTDTAGTSFTLSGSQGTGTGAGGSIIFKVAQPAASTGSTQNSLANAFVISGSTGNVAIHTSAGSNSSLRISKAITGATSAYGILNDGTVASTVTNTVAGMRAIVNTTAAAFTLTNWSAVKAEVGTIGAASAITNLRGYECDSSFVGGTTTSCFYSNIASSSGRFAVNANGTAASHFGGAVDVTTIQTLAPAGASAGLWKLGSLVTAAVVPDTTRSVFIDIGGTVYKLIVAQ